MILYLDTSSLLKLYLEEEGSADVREWVQGVERVATSLVAYPEAMSAFSRRHRAGHLNAAMLDRLVQTFDLAWRDLQWIHLDEQKAGRLALRHALRGYDAVHLAAALALQEDEVFPFFSSFDTRLNDAAAREGLPLLLPEGSA